MTARKKASHSPSNGARQVIEVPPVGGLVKRWAMAFSARRPMLTIP